jgi:hypothetical protein
MNAPVFVSYYTPGYTEPAERLIRSLTCFSLSHDVVGTGGKGNWAANCAMKPGFILRKLEEHAPRPVVWVDADAQVQSFPKLFLTLKADVAACRWSWPDRDLTETLSGTLYVAQSERARTFLKLWRDSCESHGAAPDQPYLQRSIEAVEGLESHNLPVPYCFIFDIHAGFFPWMTPVIKHFQHSRTQKKD